MKKQFTKEDMTQYGYAMKCEVNPSTIYHRVSEGNLTLNSKGLVPKGTEIIKQMKLGRKSKY